jgi:hypothetical protein
MHRLSNGSSSISESRRLLPDLETTYDQLVKRIAANGADALVPAVGEVLPNVLMTDSKGHLVDLAALLAKGPLVVSFNRGPWCDYCGLELHALARAYPGIVAAGGEVVSVVPETAHYARRLQEVRGLPFTVLTDLDLLCALPWPRVLGGRQDQGDVRPIRHRPRAVSGQWRVAVADPRDPGRRAGRPRQGPLRRPGFPPSHGHRGHFPGSRLSWAAWPVPLGAAGKI